MAESETKSKESDLDAALTRDEVERLVTMGLGRGVNATDPKPYLNKSSFQVRHVTFENIVGTEENGTRRSYENTVSSSSAIQTAMKASVTAMQPVTLGVDSEFSRGKKQNRKSRGVKVLNRTVSFKEDFKEKGTSVAEPGDVWEPGSDSTFEERLSHWILEQMQDKGIPVPETHGNPIQILTTMIKDSSGKELQKIVGALEMECLAFVCRHRITHYVSKLELGASSYRVMKEEEYTTKAKAGTNVGVTQAASVQASVSVDKKSSSKSVSQLQIGLILESGGVQRRSQHEAVIGVQVKPISHLITIPLLYRAFKKAVDDFIEDDTDKTAGPFLITCNFDRLFLMVNKKFEVVCTDDPSKASQFYVIPNDDDDDQFGIAYEAKSSQENVMPTTCYLSAPANLSGLNPGPLTVTERPTTEDLNLTIESRLTRYSVPVDLDKWVSGEDIFYINCARRFIFSNAYVCVKQYKPLKKTAPVVRPILSAPGVKPGVMPAVSTPTETELRVLQPSEDAQEDSDSPAYITACVPSVSYHNKTDTFMLFRLVRANLLQPDKQNDTTVDRFSGAPHSFGQGNPPQ